MLTSQSRNNQNESKEPVGPQNGVKQNKPKSVNPIWQGLALGQGNGSGHIQRKCSECGQNIGVSQIQAKCDECEQPEALVQTKLVVGPANDVYEQQADAVADRVLRQPDNVTSAKSLQNSGSVEDFWSKSITGGSLQSSSNSANSRVAVTPQVKRTVESPGTGESINANIKNRIESTLGADLSAARVHTDNNAALAAKDINAKAFTHQNHIFLGENQSTTDIRLIAHEATHTLQNGIQAPLIQKAPEDGADKRAADPLCADFQLETVADVEKLAEVYLAAIGTELEKDSRNTLIRFIKLVRRCVSEKGFQYLEADLLKILGEERGSAIWQESGEVFGGYVGLYPGYAGDMKRRLEKLGVSDANKFSAFDKPTTAGHARTYKRRAAASASREIADLGRTDIVYFRGHQFAQYSVPGMFTNGSEDKGIDLRYIDKVGGFTNVKLFISTSCATLCKEALEVFSRLFPNAVILGYRKSAPIDGAAVRNKFHKEMIAINKPLILEHKADIEATISAWKSTIESIHVGDTSQLPGYLQNGIVHYWDGAKWETVAPQHEDNKCRRKGNFSGSFPGPPPPTP